MKTSQHRPNLAFGAFSFSAVLLIVCAFSYVHSFAQQTMPFGKMKPQYQTFTWNFVQSRSFDVYYHEGGDYLAQYAGVALEEGVKTTQRILGFVWNERLPIIIYNSPNEARQTNAQEAFLERGAGGIYELRKNRIVVAFRGDWEEFRLALRKELALSMVNLLYYGVNLPSPINGQFDLPMWFSEGLAEYVSREGLDTETDMLVRDMIVHEQFTTMSALEGYARVKMGQMMFNYIAEKYGTSKISELITRARGMGSVEGAFRATFGVNVDGFTTLWKRDLREQYGQSPSRYEDVEKFTQRLTDAAKDGSPLFANVSAAPAFSPNADRLAYLSARDGAWGVYVQDLRPKRQDALSKVASTGRALETKYTGFDGLSLSWKPESGAKNDAAQIAFITQSSGMDGISMINPQNGNLTRFDLNYKIIRSLAFSPDGKFLAFVAVENELPNMFLYELANKKLTRLTNDVFSENLPTWSPDGKNIFFVSDRAGILTTNTSSATYSMWEHDSRSSDVYVLNLSTKKIERLTNDSYARKTALAISGDGKKLLIVSDRNGIANLYEWTIAAKTLIPRTNALTGIGAIGLQRDAARVAFTSLRKGASGIFLLQSPFDRKTKDLEPTELRKQAMEREAIAEKALGKANTMNAPSQPVTSGNASDTSIVAGVSKDAPSREPAETESPKSYGKYDIDFTKQKMVEPNPDVAARTASELVAEQNDFTKPGKLPSLPVPFNLDFDSYTVGPGFDTFFGGQQSTEVQSFLGNFAFSGQALWQDIMGNNRLHVYANALLSSLTLSNDVAITYSYLPELIDIEASLFRTSRFLFLFDSQTRAVVRSQLSYWGASGKAILPLSESMRIEGKLTIMNTIRESLDRSFAATFNRSDLLVIPEVRFTMDNSETGFFGSVSGSRAQAKVESVPGLAGLTFVRATGDYRQYFPIRNFAVIAARASVGTNIGSTPQPFYVGGQENVILGRAISDLPFSRAEDLYFTYLASPLRGFPIFSATGQNFFAANVEARVSLMQPDGSSSMLSNIVNGLQGVVFVDAGSAWTNSLRLALATPRFDAFGNPAGFENGDLLMSFGFGVRTYLLGQYPVKIDLAFQNLQTGIGRPSLMIGFGYNF
jgi:Tol biopolymer transport system component